MQTLETYLGNDGNVTKTAEQLVVDRRTITYRLERITNLLGRPMSSMETRVLLFLALKAQKRL
nr:helix-turn-helix domain-containing protein [Leucobacter chinensis]